MDIHAMVVDDSGIMRKMVMRALKQADLAHFMFTEACDGVGALESFCGTSSSRLISALDAAETRGDTISRT